MYFAPAATVGLFSTYANPLVADVVVDESAIDKSPLVVVKLTVLFSTAAGAAHEVKL